MFMAVITLHPNEDVDRIGPGLAGGATAYECLSTAGDGKSVTFGPLDDPRAFVTVGFENTLPAGATVTGLQILLDAEIDNTDGGDTAFLISVEDNASASIFSGQVWAGSGGENTTLHYDSGPIAGTWSKAQIDGMTLALGYNDQLGAVGDAALFDRVAVVATYTVPSSAPSNNRLSLGVGLGL